MVQVHLHREETGSKVYHSSYHARTFYANEQGEASCFDGHRLTGPMMRLRSRRTPEGCYMVSGQESCSEKAAGLMIQTCATT